MSTAGEAPPADLRTAVLQGLAPDGGLYLPDAIPTLDSATLASLRELDYPGVAEVVVEALVGDAADRDLVRSVTGSALDFPVPLVPVEDRGAADGYPGRYALELFHGPSLAFKDVGARFLAHLLEAFMDADSGAELTTVLVATSGDTGGAVAQAFHGLSGVEVVVLFPRGRVSPVQERQFTTLGGNVRALEVDGSFDDCQRMVTEAFQDRDLARRRRLTSANSINLGRLLPQATYYAWAWARLPEGAPPPVISVPSGNFGNLAAGLMAKSLGVPVHRFVAATNRNDVVPRYLATGRFEPRPSVRTPATAMDVGHPSNLRRIQALYGYDVEALRRDVVGTSHGDQDIRRAIARARQEDGLTLDPHAAVAWLGLEEALPGSPDVPGVFLATAHPAKFADVVEPALGEEVPMPPTLAAALQAERRVTPVAPRLDALAAEL